MSFFPTFLNPWTAAAAAAVACAALLVLYFLKLRRREVSVSSTLLWKKAIQDLQVNAPFQRLRRNLLLFLQLLILLLLCLALSRPITNYIKGPGKMTVLLIDRSASMSATDVNGKSRLEEAKRRAREMVSALDRDAVAMVIAFDDSAQTLQSFTNDASALRAAIDSIAPTDRPTRLKLAYQLAEAQMNFNPDQLRSNAPRPDVRVFSDGRVLDGNELSIRGDVTLEKIGSDDAANIAVVALNARRNYERPTEVQVFARLANYGPRPVEADVQLYVDGHVRSVGSTKLAPERWSDEQWLKDPEHKKQVDENYVSRDSVEFPPMDLTASAVIRVEQMNKQGDCLGADDSAQVIVPPPKALSVLLVTEGNYFLEKALGSLNLQKPETLIPSAYEKKIPTNYDVIIFDRYSPRKLPGAGSFIYFGAVPPTEKLKCGLGADGQPISLDGVTVLDWKRDHPILRGISLQKLYIGRVPGQLNPACLKLTAPMEAEVLVDGISGPLMLLYREGQALHLVLAFDLLQSNWPLRQSFPYFMYDAMQYLAIGADMDLRQSVVPGSTPRIPRANLQRFRDIKSIALSGPSGAKKVTVPETGDFVLPSLDEVGLYATDPPIPQYEKVAVSLLDANESNLLPANSAPGNIGEAHAGTAGKTRLELWWWIVACGALPFIFIEWWVYTRRVHL